MMYASSLIIGLILILDLIIIKRSSRKTVL